MALSVPRLLPTKTYPFSDLRHMIAATGIQPGVMASGATTEFKVTQDTGSNMNVKIAAGDSGAWVTGSDTTRQGAYHVYNDAIITTAVSAANATNPRIDQVVLRVYDSTVIGGGTDAATVEVIAGTATSGATLDNRTGAANLATIAAPKSLIRLADILVPAASTAVTNANIRDRRPWALGAHGIRSRTTGDLTTATTNATFANSVALSTADLATRLECSGAPIVATLTGAKSMPDGSFHGYYITIDGAQPTSGQATQYVPSTETGEHYFAARFQLTPTAGSHLFDIRAVSSSGTNTLTTRAGTATPLIFDISEDLRAAANNGVT